MLKQRTILALLSTFFACASACAQYVWVDEHGNKQFSDTPPPSSVPKNRILKGKNLIDSNTDTGDASSSSKAADTPRQKTDSIASRNEDYNKRKAEQAEKDKKAAEAQQAANDKSKNCERVKSYQKTLESGARVTATDKNGERNYLTDEQREKELADTKKAGLGC
ncbi:DUF4124 domain-containing protein [Undibacterium sp. Dicai25W]|uniref:DUF4124 domain-containing protein n=1 Tax=Undibacterium sp. Dicai25W TaxID=3413034 RepID=UPI003BF29404